MMVGCVEGKLDEAKLGAACSLSPDSATHQTRRNLTRSSLFGCTKDWSVALQVGQNRQILVLINKDNCKRLKNAVNIIWKCRPASLQSQRDRDITIQLIPLAVWTCGLPRQCQVDLSSSTKKSASQLVTCIVIPDLHSHPHTRETETLFRVFVGGP